MRLIDADELIKSYLDHCRIVIKGERIIDKSVISIINNAPTVDIQTAVIELYKRYQPRLATNVYEFGVELHELLGRYER